MKRKLLSFSMALCLSAMGVSVFAQTNKCTCTLDRDYTAPSNGTAARLEVSDEILGKWIGQTTDSRSNTITLEGWINFKSSTKDACTSDENGFWSFDGALSTGRVLMGHRQGNFGGFGSSPSFSISVIGEKDGVYKMSIYSRPKGSGVEDLRTTAVDIPNGWFHLALVGSVTKNENDDLYTLAYTMYVNGKEKQHVENASYTSSNLPYLSDNTDKNWGCDICFGGSMECEFDDLMIWNKALSADEVKNSIYGYAGNSFPEGLIGYYLCDDMYPDAVSNNLVDNGYNLTLQGLTYDEIWQGEAVEFKAKAPLSPDRIKDITPVRQFYRGEAPSFYSNPEGTSMAAWSLNGNEENFKYVVNTDASPLYIKGYNGKIERLNAHNSESVDYPDPDCIGLYYNGSDNQYVPVLVSADMYQEGALTSDPTSSYLMGGFEYKVQMPSTARKWFTIGFPTEVDLAYYFGSGNTGTVSQDVWLRPNYNFWYNEFNPEYQSTEDNMWNTVSATGDDDRYYKLANGGTFAVTEDFVDGTFTFYSTENSPVVFRAENAEYNQSLLPASGKLGFVANPYMESIDASVLCPGCTAYQLDDNGLFWPVDKLTVGVFDGVLVYNGNADSAPKAVNTKTTTGVLELEALSDINVRGAKESIEVVTFEPATVTVYTVGGTMVANSQVEGTETFALPAGIYVVKAVAGSETETFKVVVE